MIRGRYVSTSRPIALLVATIIMAIVAGINLGIGVNYTCWSYDDWCSYRRKAYIISGSCFAASSFFFLVATISLHLKIKQALRRNTEVVAEHGIPPVHQTANAYPTVVVAAQYPQTQPYNPAPTGFVVNQQVPPIVPSPGVEEQQQRPPPYFP